MLDNTITIMKKIYLFALASVGFMASFSACINDTEEAQEPKKEIRLTSEIIPSRVTSLGYQSTQISEGQMVGITIAEAQSTHQNVAWSVGKDGALTCTETPAYWGRTSVSITAYHPYNEQWTGTDHEFSVATDQSTEAGYSNSDLLWVSATASADNVPVSLAFAHKLAKINVTLSSDDFTDLSGFIINICGTNIATGFDPSSGTLSPIAGSIAEIKAGVTTGEATASAVIVPQTIAKGTNFIKLARNGKTFYYTLPENQTYNSGYLYSYQLKVEDSSMENLEQGEEIDW